MIIPSSFSLTPYSPDPVARHGRLQASGNRIVDKNGQNVSLAGMSLFWGNVGWTGEKYWNEDVVAFLKRDWNVTVIRAAMGVEDGGGYLDYPDNNFKKTCAIVDACIAEGIYVIIDWHSHDALGHQTEAVIFFSRMARRYGGNDHVIYEIWNEPRYVTWAEAVKPYSEAVIAAIRRFDPDNLIIVGSADWSTEVDVATADPVDDSNVAYSFHFYAASHLEKKRLQAQTALDRGKALFITEWGTCESTGDGEIDQASTEAWVKWMRDNDLSHCCWALNDKAESASVLKPGSNSRGGWIDHDLTRSGLIVRNLIRSWNQYEPVEPAGKAPAF